MHQSIGKKNKIIIYLIFLVILSTTSGKFLEQPKKYSLKINKIEVMGLSNEKNAEIKNDLNNIFYQNIFLLGKEEIQKIMNKYNIIEEYNIKKIYPSTIKIKVRPTKFLAKISSGRQPIVGSNGKLIYSESNDEILPYIFGEFNSKEFLKFKKNIELSNLNFNEFKTVYFFPSNRWDVLTIDNILIKLPKHNILESLNLAHKIITSAQFKEKNVIDLRIKKHLIIK
jgi:cell division protein FtsQ|tara:strand:+ start:16 stop:693 length:678 start_codon:yes stop_codon:yes gene_type:complete